MKQGKEVKINSFKNYNIVYGSVNNKASKAIYINLSAWVDLNIEDEINYDRIIKNINKKVKQNLYNSLENDNTTFFIKERTIVDLDIKKSGLRYGKRSFTNCEVTLFLTNEIPVNSELIKDALTDVIDLVIEVFETNKYFKFYKTKKNK